MLHINVMQTLAVTLTEAQFISIPTLLLSSLLMSWDIMLLITLILVILCVTYGTILSLLSLLAPLVEPWASLCSKQLCKKVTMI